MIMELGLEGKKVLIVGASKGIGRAITEAFSEENCQLIAIARSENLLAELRNRAMELGAVEFSYKVCDIMQCNTQKLAKTLMEQYGIPDIIVHNVGGSLVSRNHLGSMKEWGYALKFNALAAIDMNSILIPPMIERGNGIVLHVSSISAVMLRGNPLYASAKAFLNAYVTTVGRQLAPTGVRMCSVMPGAVAFPGSYWDNFIREHNPRVEDFLRHHQAADRFGDPREIADVVVFLASNRATFMQGANVPVDGANM